MIRWCDDFLFTNADGILTYTFKYDLDWMHSYFIKINQNYESLNRGTIRIVCTLELNHSQEIYHKITHVMIKELSSSNICIRYNSKNIYTKNEISYIGPHKEWHIIRFLATLPLVWKYM